MGPVGPWVCGRKELTSKGVTLLLYQNRALEQTLVKMPVPWAGLAPCPLPPQQTPEPAYPASPAFPPLSCPFASRVVYQDGFYGAEIYVSVAPGREGRLPALARFQELRLACPCPIPQPHACAWNPGGRGCPVCPEHCVPGDITQPSLGYPCSRGEPGEQKACLPRFRGCV